MKLTSILSSLLILFYFCSVSETSIRGFGGANKKYSTEAPILKTTSGQLRGLLAVKSKRVEAFQYLGVPYAEAPIGKLRFQKPEPFNGSNAIRDATELAPTCVQMRHLPQLINPLLNVDEEHRVSPVDRFPSDPY